MPRSHICPSCLTELARIRAVPDPHYGLAIVVCPGCRLACVRTKHPDREFWRTYHRTRIAIHGVVGRTMLTVLMGLSMWGLSEWSTEVFADYRGRINLIDPFVSYDTETAIGAWAIPSLALLLGMVTRLIYLHHPIWIGVGVLLICGVFMSSLDYTFGLMVDFLAHVGGFVSPVETPSNKEMIVRTEFFLMLSGIVLVGLLPGVLLGRTINQSRVKRFRKIRKKIRKRRAFGS